MNTTSIYEEIIMAGFGGQGIMMLGKLLATTAMKGERFVSYIPSYGPEVRGGTANCSVVISSESIACPIVNYPDSLIVMNQPSLERFLPQLIPGGLLVMNSSLISGTPARKDIDVVLVPADAIALEITQPRSANMVILGAYLQKKGVLTTDQAAACLPDVLSKRHADTIAANQEALYRGAEFVGKQ